MTDRTRETYRGAALIARPYGSVVQGKAWRAGTAFGAAQGQSDADVLAQLRARVDAKFTVETREQPAHYPDEDAYRIAFDGISSRLAKAYRAMLKAHHDAPERTMIARELARAAGYKDWSSANLHYGTVGKMLGESLLFQPRARPSGEPIWTLMLADGADESAREEEWRWRMRPQLAAALRAAGLA